MIHKITLNLDVCDFETVEAAVRMLFRDGATFNLVQIKAEHIVEDLIVPGPEKTDP
jgi:hypothetical protein